jgi:hypothetical protein
MAFRNKIKQSNEIENRIVYWGGNETTIIPTMASQGEVERAKRLNKIEEDLLGLKETGKKLTNEDSKAKDANLKKTIALKNEKRQLQKEESAHQAHMMKKEMELSGLKSKVLDLEESIGTVERKGLNYVTKAGKHVKTRGQLVMKLSREYFLQGLHHQNMFNTQANMARMLETINTLKNKAVKYDTKSTEMAALETNEIDKLQTAKNADSTEGKAKIAATLAGAAAYKGSLELVKDAYTQIGEIQSENLGATVKLAKMYGNLGKGGFQDMTKEMETQLQRAKDQAKFTLTEQLPALQKELKLMKIKMKHMDKGSDLYKKMVEDMEEMEAEGKLIATDAENAVIAAEKNVKHAQLMSKIQGNVAASSQLILGPFEKMQSLLESNPLGKWVSTLTGLDSQMKTFADTVSEEMTSAFTPPTVKSGMDKNGKQFFMDLETGRRISEETYDSQKKNGQTMQESLANVQEQAMGAIDKISGSFGQMNAMMGGMLGPILGIVAVLMIAKKIAELFYGGMAETRKEFGLTFAEAGKLQNVLNTTAMEFKMMGVSAEDVKAGAVGIMDNLGGIGQITKENVTEMARLNASYGLSGESAGVLASQMMAVGASSMDAVGSQIDSVAALAQASGVAPAKVLEDVAGASEAFANYAKDGGENVFKAAIAARQLGVSMDTVAGTADALLDFESSINAQMEASMLTGRNINTDKARELALAGDLEGMQKEITKQIGSAADYEKLNVVQRKAMAAAFGVSVSELGKMVTNQDKLNSMTDVQKKRQDLIADVIKQIGVLWTKFLGVFKSLIPLALTFLSPIIAILGAILLIGAGINIAVEWLNKFSIAGVGLGNIIMVAAGAALLFRSNLMGGGIMGYLGKMKDAMFSMGGKLKDMSGFGGKGGDKKGGGFVDKIKKKFTGGDKTKSTKLPGKDKGGGPMESMFGKDSKIDYKKMIQGAAAMLIVAVAMFVMAKALQEFAKVTWEAIAKAGVTLLGLVVVLGILGQLKGQLIQGAVAMLIMSVALIPFAFALQMFTGIDFKQVALGGVAMIGFAIAMGVLGTAASFIIMGAVAMAIMGVALIPFAFALQMFTGIDFKQVAFGGVAMIGFAIAMGLLGMAAPAIIFGSVAMAIMSVALVPFTLALRLFSGIDFAQVKLGGIAMLGLGTALGALGFMAPLIIAGSWAVGIMSIALMGLGIALILIGTGMKLFQGSVSSIVEPLTQLASIVGPLLLLAGAFAALGISMGVMAIGALLLVPVLPVLMALSAMGLLGGVSLGGGGEEAEAGGGTEANPVEVKIGETNRKLDELIQLLGQSGPISMGVGGVKSNTKAISEQIV